jgi:hypothetical protein
MAAAVPIAAIPTIPAIQQYMINVLRVPQRAAELLVEEGIDDFDDFCQPG